jgi:chromosome segregation ATPase
LGGDIGTLRRQRNLIEFINTDTNAEKAEIRLKLHRNSANGAKNHYDVMCKLFKNGRSTFELDGTVVQRSEVVALASRLKIQTNNLCQFLPQDVVREFPSMSPEKMFENTIQAAGEKSLLQEHNVLKNLQNECKSLQVSVEQKRNTFKDLVGKSEAAEAIRRAEAERKERERRIELFRKQEKYLLADMLRKDLKRTKIEKDERVEKVKQAEAEVERSGSFESSYESKSADMKRSMKVNESVVTAMAQKLKRHAVSENEEKLKSIARELESLELERGNSRQRIRELEGQLAILRPKHTELDKLDLKSKLEEESGRYHEVALEMSPLESDHSKLKSDQQQIDARLGNLQKRKKELSSMDENRLKQLRSVNSDAYEGVQWLKANRERFQQPVHDPLAVTINLLDDKYAVYVERLAGKHDLEAFLCEDPRDATSLMNALRVNNRLRKINVVQSRPESFKPPAVQLRNLDRFVSQMFTCPPAVKAYLCRKKKLHQIPVFSGSCDHQEVQKHFHTYFVDKQMYTCSKGFYSGEVRMKIQDCSYDTAKHLVAAAVDREELAAVNKEIEQVQTEKNESSLKQSDLEKRIREGKTKMKRIEEGRKKLNQQIDTLNKLAREIKSTESHIEHLKKNEESDRAKKVKRKEELLITRKSAALEQVGDVLEFHKFAKVHLEASVEVHKYAAWASYLEVSSSMIYKYMLS